MTKAQAAAFRHRWKQASAAEIREVRSMSIEEKERRLAALMGSASLFSRHDARARDKQKIRRLWSRLRRRVLAKD